VSAPQPAIDTREEARRIAQEKPDFAIACVEFVLDVRYCEDARDYCMRAIELNREAADQ